MIGPYKLMQLIGEGGFGTVFMAEQDHPVRRSVALKIIKLGMDTRQVVARFEQERQALALMDHPGIAKVFDAGSTDSGRPYFVMELCRGEPITDYCDRNSVSIPSRLELFVQVCLAIQHAHLRGLIHRDIKPTNILVSCQDGEHRAKVIDFGIAKATATKLTDKTLVTEHRQLIGTPEYMSPEQAEGSLDIDTRTDVYALGVLLYELLTGSTPFSSETLRSAAYADIQRIIREVDPPLPSTRVRSSATIAPIAARRRSEPERLGTTIQGELDWIAMKSLEKDRQRRYESARALADDVQRYLNGAAVLAAPPSKTYRMRKFVVQHKWPAVAVAATASALVLGLAGTLWQARRADDRAAAAQAAEAEQRRLAISEAHQRQEADTLRLAAETAAAGEKARAEQLRQVAAFQSNMLSDVNASEAGKALFANIRDKYSASLAKHGVPESARVAQLSTFDSDLQRVNGTDVAADLIDSTLLKPAITELNVEFRDQPLVAASLRHSLALVYSRLGRYDDALPLQEQALADRRQYGTDAKETLESTGRMGQALRDLGRLADAEPYYRECMEKSRRMLGENATVTITAINDMAYILQTRGKLAEAEPLYREALEKCRRVRGEEHPETLTMINNMGFILNARGKTAEAEPYHRDAFEKRRRVLGEDHPDTLGARNNLAFMLQQQGKFAEAESEYRQTLERRTRVLGETHPDTLVSKSNLAWLFRSVGKLDESEPLMREVLATRRHTLGEEHPSTLNSLANLGQLMQSKGNLDDAESLYTEAILRRRRVLGNEHPDTLWTIMLLANLRQAQTRYEESEVLCREATETRRRVLGPDHPDTARAIGGLGYCLHMQKKYELAEPLYREVLDIRRRLLGNGHTDTLTSIMNLGSLLRDKGVLGEAESLHRESLAGFEHSLGKDHWRTGDARLQLGRTLTLRKDFVTAVVELKEAQRVLSTAQGSTALRNKQSIEAILQLYRDWKLVDPSFTHDDAAAAWQSSLDALSLPASPATP